MTVAILVVGEAVVDLIGVGDQAFHAMPGGSPMNVAVAAARLCMPTYFAGRFAPDRFGTLLRRHALEHRVDLSVSVDASDGASALAVATLDANGSADYSFYLDSAPDWKWTRDSLAAAPDVTVVHTGSLVTMMPPGAEAVLEYCRGLRAAGDTLVSYDANVRPSIARDRERAGVQVDRFAAAAHLVKASADDLAWLWPDRDRLDVARRWLAAGSGCVVITDGANGVDVVTRGGELHLPAVAVDVVDTVGAGDAFTGAYLSTLAGSAQLVESWDDMCAQAPQAAFGPATRRAVTAAALTCANAGALGPSADELDKVMQIDGTADHG